MNFKNIVLALTKPMPIAYTCPVTGGKAYIKSFTVAEREQYSKAVLGADDGLANATAFSLIMCDKDGKRLFDDGDIDKIKELPENVVSEALTVFNTQKLPSVDDAKKNS